MSLFSTILGLLNVICLTPGVELDHQTVVFAEFLRMQWGAELLRDKRADFAAVKLIVRKIEDDVQHVESLPVRNSH